VKDLFYHTILMFLKFYAFEEASEACKMQF